MNQKPTPYNHCSLCGKWLGFISYLQFWEQFKVCQNCSSWSKNK